ncbi:hypothetical protein TNCV_1704431 [Trichonephila clavipes]|nr:hypothetical protein TNCV_1704431 [Trichonephila clavipes]
MNKFIQENKIDWNRCVGISTDGAKSMVETNKGVVERIQNVDVQKGFGNTDNLPSIKKKKKRRTENELSDRDKNCCPTRSSTFPGRCICLLIIPQIYTTGERSGDLSDQIVFDKLKNGSKTALRMWSTYCCAVNVPLMTTKGVRLSKEMAPLTITPG